MKLKLHAAALFFATAIYGYGQQPQADPAKVESATQAQANQESAPAEIQESVVESPDTGIADPIGGRILPGYSRPDAKKRFKNYLDNVAGPFALAQYAGTAALLTGRNSPKEWGAKRDGFGRRVANQFGKSIIINTTIYGMDEALKVDSKFYRSRDRSVAARLRNSVFSAVTARNRRGKRVIGIPRITGSLAAEIVSSKTWYPSRFNVLHGIKGGGIALGVNVGVNLLKEFVWK